MPVDAADNPGRDWQASGHYFTWQSPENPGRPVQIFYACFGDPTKPAIVMLHGFPTSSFDYRLLIQALQAEFYICTLDFAGYGVSDKPGDGYRYTLGDDARLAWDFVTDIVKLREFVLLSHDRGDSVALSFLQLYQAAEHPPFRITHQFLTNANLYLPLANLTDFQTRMLDPLTSAATAQRVSAERLAAGMGAVNYSPALRADDPEVRGLAFNFAWQNGVAVMPATIQYLHERKVMEVEFLEALARSDVPATLIWGIHDMVSPLRVAEHVWNTALKPRAAPASYWILPCANHYLQHDQPEALAAVIALVLGGKTPAAPFNLTTDACAPVLVAAK